jgi:hypothetical protein
MICSLLRCSPKVAVLNCLKQKLMLHRIFLLLFCAFSATFLTYAGNGETTYEAIIMFPSAPNPTSDKCLIRTYLPDSDPNSSIRILDKDSTMIKEIPLAGQIGISSTPINVEDWKAGTYLYQLFYKGEARKTLSFVVKH